MTDLSRDEVWEFLHELNAQAYDLAFDYWKKAGDREDLLEQASKVQQAEFVELCDSTLTNEYWAAIERQYKLEEDFKMQFEAYAGRPINLD